MAEDMNEMNEMEPNAEAETMTGADQGVKANGAAARRVPLIAGSVVAVVFALALGVWWFAIRGHGGGGQAVSAPKNVSFDEGGGGGGGESPAITEESVTIPEEQIDRIGLKTAVVGETMAAEAADSSASGVVEANQYQSTPAITLAGGVVRRMLVERGQSVAKGQAVAVVFSPELAEAQAKYLQMLTDARTARQNLARTEKLVLINQSGKNERDEARAKLTAAEAAFDEQGKRYQRTQKLVAIGGASREEMEQATTMYRTAEAEVTQLRARLERASDVAAINPQARSEFEMAQVRVQTAESELAGARQRLFLLGMPESRVASLANASQISSELVVAAPVAGTVTARSANAGEAVEANKELLRVTNLSSVWAIAQVYERDLAAMRPGTGASVSSEAYPGRLFRGQVTYVDPSINPETRTAQVRVELENPGGVLKIGQFVKVSFGSLGNAEKTAPVVPSAAVQNVRGGSVVFVATEKPNVFIMKPVRLGPERDGRFPVQEGINVGDRVVTDGSFLLRAEVLKRGS